MVKPAEILHNLRTDMGEQARMLQHIPLSKVETGLSRDNDALSFALFVGHMRCQYDKTKLSVWVHLYPARGPTSNSEIHYLACKGDEFHSKYDGDVISKQATSFRDAFKVPGKCTKAKLQSLSKYYFLKKLVEAGVEEDEEKMRFGMLITKTWVSDLKAVCRAWEEETKDREQDRQRASIATASRANVEVIDEAGREGANNTARGEQGAATNVDNGPDSSLSDVPLGFLSESDEDIDGVRKAPVARVQQVQPVSQDDRSVTPENDDTSNTLITLNDEEEDLSREIGNVEAQIAALQEERLKKQEKLKQIEDRRERIVEGLSDVQMAFKLGREVGRKCGTKRIKLE